MLRLFVKASAFGQRIARKVTGFVEKEEGATIAEYAILLAVVVVALITILGQLTSALEGKLSEIINEIGSSSVY